MKPEFRELIVTAHCELACAIAQSLPSDDQIIMGRVRTAEAILAAILEASNA